MAHSLDENSYYSEDEDNCIESSYSSRTNKSLTERREPKLIISDSEDDDEDSDKATISTVSPSLRHSSQLQSEKNEVTSESSHEDYRSGEYENSDDDLDIINHRKLIRKKNVIESDSSDDDCNHISSVDNQEAEIENIVKDLNESTISDDFKIDRGNKLNSTILDTGTNLTPKCNVRSSSHSKRSLNRSVDTPRIIKQIRESTTPIHSENKTPTNINKSEIEFCSDDDIIDISSDDDVAVTSKQSIKSFKAESVEISKKEKYFHKEESKEGTRKQNSIEYVSPEENKNEIDSEIVKVSYDEYQLQRNKIERIESDIKNAAFLLRTVKLEHLPDQGKSILVKHEALEEKLMDEVKILSKMTITGEKKSQAGPTTIKSKILQWNEIEAQAGAVQPRTFGKQAVSTYNAQKAVTMDRLQQLHGSLATRPKEIDLADNPKGLKVELMDHQKHALSWMMWRETQKPSGGILADDMGLGKTLTMISLVIKTNQNEQEESDSSDTENDSEKSTKPLGGTLVVCPASLINQWSSELEHRTKRGLVSFEVYHGPKRETKPKRLAQHDMVITTYAIVNNECEKMGTVFRVKWKRIIIDEAHQIRNHKSQTSVAVCKLAAKSRWALTGTPVHNKELDMYALLKYLRCTPFDDLQVWKRWVGDKSTGGQERLHTIISSLMLRRTKVELMEKGSLQNLPDRQWELVPIQLTKPELDIYNRILIFSRTLFAQFLHQRAEKNQDAKNLYFESKNQINNNPNEEYLKMRQKLLNLNKVKDIKQHEILVLLLRLRQICCHPSLITGMLHEDMGDLDGDDQDSTEDDHAAELDLLDQLNNLALNDDDVNSSTRFLDGGPVNSEAPKLKDAARGLLNRNNPVFSKEKMSSKIKAMLKVLQEKVLTNNDKAIIVSQWSSFLGLIAYHLKQEKIPFDQLDGTVPVNKRMGIVESFNDPKHKMKVLLLSLTAGGVGLNLVGGNHLFLLDLHWNPQLENQAQDRIYRMGQQKSVFIYKFMAEDTIEKRILDLQEKKLEIAQSMLTGTKQVSQNKLSLQDLKMLFEM